MIRSSKWKIAGLVWVGIGLTVLHSVAAEPDLEPATWIIPQGDVSNAPAVSHYRLAFNLDPVPASYVVEVSASSIFHLYLNGDRIASGPVSNGTAMTRTI